MTFVRIGSSQAAGYRKPMTIAAAISRSTCPIAMLIVTGASTPRKNARQPVEPAEDGDAISAVQAAANTGNGSAVSGAISWAKAGE